MVYVVRCVGYQYIHVLYGVVVEYGVVCCYYWYVEVGVLVEVECIG